MGKISFLLKLVTETEPSSNAKGGTRSTKFHRFGRVYRSYMLGYPSKSSLAMRSRNLFVFFTSPEPEAPRTKFHDAQITSKEMKSTTRSLIGPSLLPQTKLGFRDLWRSGDERGGPGRECTKRKPTRAASGTPAGLGVQRTRLAQFGC